MIPLGLILVWFAPSIVACHLIGKAKHRTLDWSWGFGLLGWVGVPALLFDEWRHPQQ